MSSYAPPAATFDSWPTTRVGALVVDLLLLAVAVVLWTSPRCKYRETGGGGGGGGGERAAVHSRFRMWGFWVCGLDRIRFVGAQALVDRRRLSLRCRGAIAIAIDKRDLRGVELARQPLTPASLGATLLASCSLGLWLHYVPCLWWTCDWTEGDAPRARCAVWLAAWAASFVALCLATSRSLALRVAYERDGDGFEHELLLAIADGDRYASDDPSAAAALTAVREAMYRRGEAGRSALPRPVYVP